MCVCVDDCDIDLLCVHVIRVGVRTGAHVESTIAQVVVHDTSSIMLGRVSVERWLPR